MKPDEINDRLRAATLNIGNWMLHYSPGHPEILLSSHDAFAKSVWGTTLEIGSISARAVAMNPALLDAFISLMNAAFIAQLTPATHQTTLIENGGNDF